jgi:hypothetical protein
MKKSKETLLERYGVDSPAKCKEIRKKATDSYNRNKNEDPEFLLRRNKKWINSMIKKYGENWKEELKKAQEEAMLEKYGAKHTSDVPEILEKTRNKLRNKTKEENDEMVAKVKKTKLENYGDENYTNKDQTRKTNQERYGGNCPTCRKDIVEKGIETRSK